MSAELITLAIFLGVVLGYFGYIAFAVLMKLSELVWLLRRLIARTEVL